MIEYKRICPKCGKEIFYQHKETCLKAEKSKSLCRSCGCYKRASIERLGDLSKLLENTYEAFYWIGFLLADGSFNNTRLRFGLSAKDIDHLKNFGKFINYKGEYNIKTKKLGDKEFKCCRISVQDSIIVPKIMKKFDIHQNKTKNPPNTILKWDKNFILALFAGYFDGDGCVVRKTNRRDAKIGIQVHKSWLNILNEFNKVVFNNLCNCNINYRGYAFLSSETFQIVKKLKLDVLNLNVPILKRKWDKIDETYINRNEKSKLANEGVIIDLNNGMTRKEISQKYNISQAFITKIIKNNER